VAAVTTSERFEIRVDRAACRGAGECTLRAPNTFELDTEKRSVVKNPTGEARDVIIAAAHSCPHFAITVLSGEN
jgi:ferredoxin